MSKVKQERTFVMVKPDGVKKGLIGEIIRRFEQRDLKIVALEMFQPTYDLIDQHYPNNPEWLARIGNRTLSTCEKYGLDPMEITGSNIAEEIGPMVRKWLVDYMIAAPIVKMVVEGAHAVDMVRKIAGNTMPYLAEMGTIRGDYSNDSPAIANSEKRAIMNVVHASETQEEAAHEIKHWFGDTKFHSYKRHGDE